MALNPEIRHVWKTEKAGSLARLQYQQDDRPEPGPAHVLVEVKAIGLNFADIFALLGLYSATPKGAFIPGLEFSGVVTRTGRDVTAFQVGDAIIGVTRFGGYASHICVDADFCIRLPKSWNFGEGAAYPVQTLTAWYGLHTLGQAARGETVLIHSAAGGVGLQALAICRKLGLRAVGTVGSHSKKEFLASQSCDDIIIRTPNFAEDLQRLLQGAPLHIVLDAIGGRVQEQSYRLLAPRGRLIVYGAAEHMSQGPRPDYIKSLWRYLRRPRYDSLEMISSNKSVMGFNLIWLWHEAELMKKLLGELHELQLMPPYVGARFPFEEAHEAIRHLQSGQSVGKVVLELGQ